jgi:hypothetical protein
MAVACDHITGTFDGTIETTEFLIAIACSGFKIKIYIANTP